MNEITDERQENAKELDTGFESHSGGKFPLTLHNYDHGIDFAVQPDGLAVTVEALSHVSPNE
jgi:hypothetical protein